jgi:transposase
MKVTTSGIDVAKSVFQAHGVDERGNVMLRRQIRRSQMLVFFSRLEPCLIGMEACASSHYWARKLTALGHMVRLMAPQFVNLIARMTRTMATTPRRSVASGPSRKDHRPAPEAARQESRY